ncbi:transcription repressor NadR [Terribacillus sp. 7520-G]|uniref:transcription repressor NadR n=1 Tax=Terribacillus TaxID=459532 RepID=UPI000BA5569B|nr:transcription repressor NadR [Terribacillus sp. 7520-G]PAD37890.1 transcription repressor NadR [Terribacillus sp. 7520-G]
MVQEKKKLLGKTRRKWLLEKLQTANGPLKGSELAKEANVSRQVIVGDVTLLKAEQHPIIATSEGYILQQQPVYSVERIVACQHAPGRTEEELQLLVDLGVTVKDVRVEHPVYGQITASIMVSSRREVKKFIERIANSRAGYLSELTEGIHLHTLAADDESIMDEAIELLRERGLLVPEWD